MDYKNVHEMETKEPIPGMKARFLHSDSMTFAYWEIAEGAELPEHAHSHEQVLHVFEGEFDFTVDGETKRIGPGSVVVIPSNAVHSSKSLKKGWVLDVFHPVREDYK
jgi:quercetin dioxygenase-like cupin family protein